MAQDRYNHKVQERHAEVRKMQPADDEKRQNPVKTDVSAATSGRQYGPRGERTAWVGYAAALAAVIVITAILHVIINFVDIGKFPALYVIAVIWITYAYGGRVGFFTFALVFLAHEYFFIVPRHMLWPIANSMEGWSALIALSLGSLIGGGAALVVRKSNKRALQFAEELCNANERLTNTLESITDAFFTLDPNDNFVYVNQAAERLMRKDRHALIGKSISSEFPMLKGTVFAEGYRRVKSSRKPEELEGSFPPPINLWFEVRYYPSKDDIAVYFHDITDRKQAEEARNHLVEQINMETQLAEELSEKAQASAQELNAIFTALTDAIVVYDTEGTIIRANPAAVRAYGFDPLNVSRNTVVRKLAIRYINGSIISAEELPSSKALREKNDIYEIFAYTDINGEEKIILASASPIMEDQEPVGVVAIWHDITQLKRTEEALGKAKDSAEQTLATLQTVVDTVPVGLIVARRDGSISFTNKAAAEILGGSITVTPQGVGLDAQYILLDSDGVPIPLEDFPINQSLKKGEVTFNREEIVERMSGQNVTVLENSGPIRDAHGNIISAVSTITDITELVKLRDKLENQVSLLQRALLPKTQSLNGKYDISTAYVPGSAGSEIGGDFYDVFKTEDGEVGILIGDVSGKGIEAASTAAASRSTAHAFAYDLSSAGQALEHTNCVILAQQSSDFGFFVTMFLAILNPVTGLIRYSNAGHPPPAILYKNGDVEFLTFGHLPIGLMPNEEYTERRAELHQGDKIVFYTDGISESRHAGQMFGEKGIESVLKKFGKLSTEKLVQKLLQTADEWSDGRLIDDVAIVIVERLES